MFGIDEGIYDRQGKPIDFLTWGLLSDDYNYQNVQDDHFGDLRVSTTWIGLDHDFRRSGTPVIFETMIFGPLLNNWDYRYSTEEEARTGHAMILNWLFIGGGLLTAARQIEDGRERHRRVTWARQTRRAYMRRVSLRHDDLPGTDSR